MDSQLLVDQLRQLDLLPAEPAAEETLLQLQQQTLDGKALATELMARKLLTLYQAKLLLAGKGHSLALGPYRIAERLGYGTSAQVFKAQHARLQRVVALKVIRPDWVAKNPAAVERFFREARAAATLSHSNVVRAYDVGQEGEVYYYAMQFVDGVDLARLIREGGQLTVDRAGDYILQAARGLQHIHEHGMIHRDVKPGNLIVTSSAAEAPGRWGQVKILDLGMARLNEDPSTPDQRKTVTKLGTIMGTPDYIAPEQAQDCRKADIRSDIYSLGCTFYFVLAGQPPFPGGDAIEKILKHIIEQPRPIAELRPDVPVPVQSILQKMMAKKKEERYQTPTEVIQALQERFQPAVSEPAPGAPSNPPQDATPLAEPPVASAIDSLPALDLPPLLRPTLVRVPSQRADWGLWLMLAFACLGAIACVIAAVSVMLR
jgi:serine/threonine-protein kinase